MQVIHTGNGHFYLENSMTYLFAIGACLLFILVLSGYLRLKTWESQGRVVNADWLDNDEKFKLLTRWGAQ